MMDTLGALEMFVRSTRTGSFSGAARMLGVTPAAVSKQVGRLELELGVQLLVRTTRKLMVTDEGRRVLAEAEPAMEALRAAVSGARSGEREIGGVLRVSLPAAFGRQYVLPTMATFLDAHPALRIDWRFENQQVDLVAEDLDAGIAGGVNLAGGLVARPLVPLHMVFVAAPSYLRRVAAPRQLDDLSRYDAIVLRSKSTRRARPWRMQRRGEFVSIEPKARLWLDEPEAIAAAAQLGYGVALLGLPHAAPHLQSGALVRLLPNWWSDGGMISVYFPRNRQMPFKTRTFVDHLTAALSDERIQRLLSAMG
jgi:DNA-binding transcriptional LysR family regulator